MQNVGILRLALLTLAGSRCAADRGQWSPLTMRAPDTMSIGRQVRRFQSQPNYTCCENAEVGEWGVSFESFTPIGSARAELDALKGELRASGIRSGAASLRYYSG